MTDSTQLESAIYRGRVRHRRFAPRRHGFSLPLFMMWLKIDEIPAVLDTAWQLGRGPLSWARFRRADYIGPADQGIDTAVRRKIADLSGTPIERLEGDVFMLCQLRYLGLYFSPLTLYYLRQNGDWRYLLAEVSNTPWNERHYYLLDAADPVDHPKAFHVSPFNPMDQQYRWRLTPPDSRHRGCVVHIESRGQEPGENSDKGSGERSGKVFDATLTLRRYPLNQKEFTRVLLRTPVQTLNIVAGIYWQALKLLLKRLPLYGHPDRPGTETGKGIL